MASERAIIKRIAASPGMMTVLRYRAKAVAADGAAGSNVPTYRHAAEQRDAFWLLLRGLAENDKAAVASVMKALEYGWSKQTPKGNFSNGVGATAQQAVGADAFFVHFACHADRVISGSRYSLTYSRRLSAMRLRLANARAWLDANRDELYRQDADTTNRLLFDEGAFSIGGDPDDFLDYALESQLANGVFKEKGGYDSSYQAVSLLRLAEIILYSSSPATEELIDALTSGAAWLATRIEQSGRIMTAGNTRTGIGAEGDKDVNYYEVALCMYYLAELVHPSYAALGDRIAAYMIANS